MKNNGISKSYKATSNSPTAEGDRMGKELKESGKEVMIMARGYHFLKFLLY